mmetsp:Transcript_27083/g.33613  ORF Transcript_27083/g.33613 Transcript_27083/m.33613 type:complete len:206 (+) Transcript_27083:1198-1815(+)
MSPRSRSPRWRSTMEVLNICLARSSTLIAIKATWVACISSLTWSPTFSSSARPSVASSTPRCHTRSCSTSARASSNSTSRLGSVLPTPTTSLLISTTSRSPAETTSCLTTLKTTSPRSSLQGGSTPRKLRKRLQSPKKLSLRLSNLQGKKLETRVHQRSSHLRIRLCKLCKRASRHQSGLSLCLTRSLQPATRAVRKSDRTSPSE